MAQSGRSDQSIEIEPLVHDLKAKLNNARSKPMPPILQSHCIFQTPSLLSRHKPEVFRPNYFSVGPMHHGKLVDGEKMKIQYLKGLLSRVVLANQAETMSNSEKAKEIKEQEILTDLINTVKSIEKQASCCYEGHDYAAELGDKFVDMLVLDGCFIIELFRKDSSQVAKGNDDPIYSVSCMLQFLHHDLILLENQVPWLVLEILFNKTKLPYEKSSLIKLTHRFFATKFTTHLPPIKEDMFQQIVIKHILDFLRLSLVLPSQRVSSFPIFRWALERPIYEWQPIPSLTRLKVAGVRFEKVTPESILDIRFRKNGILEIPSLLIQETTETIFRNLIAYEQCLPNCPPVFTSYAMILSNLIDTIEDTQMLCKKGIIDNWVSAEVATKFFDKLYYNIYVKEFYYYELCDDLNNYCKRLWPRWRATYVHSYLSKSWIVVVVAAQLYAFTMFGLTFLQTFFTVKK